MHIKSNFTLTNYIRLDTKKCTACWHCIEKCSAGIIGKVDIIFHKHVIINKPNQCNGCLQCANICSSDAIEVVQKIIDFETLRIEKSNNGKHQ